MEKLKEELKEKTSGIIDDVDKIEYFIDERGMQISAKYLQEWKNKKDRYKVALKMLDAGCIALPF